ncbi:ABC transporter ATP-binding protein [Xylanibacillus composti]|uniref:ABC transporter ATP-binding protein n=1 Tax=Xylanibacillus composti TaxID=1572762 RepID=A0A8J4H3A3_9BACL|nr:ABC transporter ATP-binding protein [Xylanibacillus composti]MDT9724890.1 ABC transporter ATP-binding protein [Xylanibacillus composti]GIQ68124.1 ABC transporter ATP-binding protein [Xylanibacillus composti]
MDLLNANFITKKYSSASTQAELQSLSYKFKKGNIYVIKGKSGSGKSTLLNILGGMDKPTSGSVYYKGRSFYELSDKEQSIIRNKEFGFIFQSFNLIPELTVQDNIHIPKYFNKDLQISSSSVEDLSHELGIYSILHKKPPQLSGGEQQRVAIARALITNPEIIFADEPTGNLDLANTTKIADLLVYLVASRNSTLILVTHEQNLIKHPHIELTLQDGVLKADEANV